MTKKGFLYGTFILMGAGFINKILGFIYRIALSRIIGDEGMGLFQMVFPILIFTVVVTTAGIPIAISKLVSEAEAKNEVSRIPSILIVATLIIISTSIIVTSLTILFAPFIARTLLTDERTMTSLIAMTPIIPIIAISSIFRGYFQGKQNMSPYASSLIIEQLVRIFTVLFLAYLLLPMGVQYAAAGAMAGMVIGELTGMSYLIYRFKKNPRRPFFSLFRIKITDFQNTIRDLLRIAVPVTFSRTITSLSYAVEPIVVSQSLALAGIATATSTALYGQLEGMALPLVFFPAFITYALTISLVPAISEAAAKNNQKLVEHRLQQALRLSFIIGAPCAVVVFLLAEPLAILLYKQPEVARLMKIMAPLSLFYYIQGPLTAVLQGLDQANVAMRNSIIGAIMKIILIFILASRPELGIDGVAIAINGGIIVVTVLHFLSIVRLVPFFIQIKGLLKLTLAVTIMAYVIHQLMAQEQISPLLRVLITLGGSFGIYLVLLFLFALIRREDIKKIPHIGPWIARFLPH